MDGGLSAFDSPCLHLASNSLPPKIQLVLLPFWGRDSRQIALALLLLSSRPFLSNTYYMNTENNVVTLFHANTIDEKIV